MKIFKNKLFIGLLCIVIGALVAFVAIPGIQSSNAKETTAVRLKQSIESGTQITAEMLEVVSVPQNLVSGGLTEPGSAIGKYAASDLYAGDFLSATKLSATLEEGNTLIAATAKNKLVVSVTLPTLASGVSGRLLPGDIVSIISTPLNSNLNQSLGLEPDTDEGEPVQSNGTVIVPELRYLEVCMVVNGEASDARVSANPTEDEKNSLPVTISFYATEAQAIKLAELEQNSKIHIAFVARGEAASQYISDTERVLVGTVGTEAD